MPTKGWDPLASNREATGIDPKDKTSKRALARRDRPGNTDLFSGDSFKAGFELVAAELQDSDDAAVTRPTYV
jgi:hypothetical protein